MGDNGAMTSDRRNPTAALFSVLGLLLIGFGAGYLLSQRLNGPAASNLTVPAGLNLVVLPAPRDLPPFRLHRHDGSPFTPETLRGHWNILFFGYTHCPDVCPLALQNLQYAWQQLQPAADDPGRPRVWFVSVDPDRDSLELLGQYVTYFHPDFNGVTGPADQIDILTRALGILYGFEDKAPGQNDYAVNHSSQIVFVDPQGRMRAVLSPPWDGDDMVRALRWLESHGRAPTFLPLQPQPEIPA